MARAAQARCAHQAGRGDARGAPLGARAAVFSLALLPPVAVALSGEDAASLFFSALDADGVLNQITSRLGALRERVGRLLPLLHPVVVRAAVVDVLLGLPRLVAVALPLDEELALAAVHRGAPPLVEEALDDVLALSLIHI